MTLFDQEIKYFEEIKNIYKPVVGFHLVLDLDAYKMGQEIVQKFRFDSADYFHLVNIEVREKNKEIVIITSNSGGFIEYDSHGLYLMYDCSKNLVLDFYDRTPNPHKLNRSLNHQMKLLVFDLNHPKPKKPAC
jgi:hypothetical protein